MKNKLQSKNGSALVMVLFVTTFVAILAAGLLRWSLGERRLIERHEARLRAKSAAESLAEYGSAQLRFKLEALTNLPEQALKPDSNHALIKPNPTKYFGANFAAGASHPSDVWPVLQGGTIPHSSELIYIDPADENNKFDQLRGKWARIKDIEIFASASIPTGMGDYTTAYAAQSLQVRDTALFSHAIFYNPVLEFHPGPEMDIYGPVHANGRIVAQAVNKLRFHEAVTTSEDLVYGHIYGESQKTGRVYWKNEDDNFITNKIDGDYYHSGTSSFPDPEDDWESFSSNRWAGNLQTAAHGIEENVPVAFSEYEPDNPDTADYDPVNSGIEIIQPLLPTDHANYSEQLEKQKMAHKAGLIVSWDSYTGAVTARNQAGNPVDISELEDSSNDDIYELQRDGSSELWRVNTNSMQDNRRGARLTTLDFNVGKLKQLVESPDPDDEELHIGGYEPASHWNGVVYFEVTSSNPNTSEQERLDYTGIRLWGGETSNQAASKGHGIPSRGSDTGATFATNNAMYVLGNFNADGQRHQSNSPYHSAVVPESGEVPVAVLADSVTFLSEDWRDSQSGQRKRAEHTEVSVSMVSGIIPSDKLGNNIGSGGAHNLPRFLENWGSRDFFIRGSIVCLYESEVDDSTFGSSGVYSPPRRKWGFSQQLREGTFPPGTPLLRTYRRVNYRLLSQDDFDTEMGALPWAGNAGG